MAELLCASPLVSIGYLGPLSQIGLRLHPHFPAYLAGLPIPLVPNRVAAMGAVRVLWLGPDEWLVTAEGEALDLLPRLERAVAGRRAAVTDLSASRVALDISGSGARALIAAGCSLDLHPRAFAPNHCGQTLLARVPVILDQLDETPRFRLLVRRSHARWLADWLVDAAQGLER
ncbi:MAG TPA: sarcosine oxidase subunit gamma family protein [Stellaceae bacterium]|nr:sarcosine oxidase subunit gamma family protein [Stellaceae bacterium]